VIAVIAGIDLRWEADHCNAVSTHIAQLENIMSTQSDTQELAKIPLTDEQKAQISKATGVKLSELSVLKLTGASARQLHSSLLDGHAVVACW